jgi:hypothetical protein
MPEHTYKPSIGWWLKDSRGLWAGRAYESAKKKAGANCIHSCLLIIADFEGISIWGNPFASAWRCR